jgi:hypothetical protein
VKKGEGGGDVGGELLEMWFRGSERI